MPNKVIFFLAAIPFPCTLLFRMLWMLLPAPNVYCAFLFYLHTLFLPLPLPISFSFIIFGMALCVNAINNSFVKFHRMFFSNFILLFPVRLLSSGDDWYAPIVTSFLWHGQLMNFNFSCLLLRMFPGCSFTTSAFVCVANALLNADARAETSIAHITHFGPTPMEIVGQLIWQIKLIDRIYILHGTRLWWKVPIHIRGIHFEANRIGHHGFGFRWNWTQFKYRIIGLI